MRIDELHELTSIAHALLAAPGWARVGITSAKEHQREEAAKELARAVLRGTEAELGDSSDQLRLSL